MKPMDCAGFSSLSSRDFANGAVLDEIHAALNERDRLIRFLRTHPLHCLVADKDPLGDEAFLIIDAPPSNIRGSGVSILDAIMDFELGERIDK